MLFFWFETFVKTASVSQNELFNYDVNSKLGDVSNSINRRLRECVREVILYEKNKLDCSEVKMNVVWPADGKFLSQKKQWINKILLEGKQLYDSTLQ